DVRSSKTEISVTLGRKPVHGDIGSRSRQDSTDGHRPRARDIGQLVESIGVETLNQRAVGPSVQVVCPIISKTKLLIEAYVAIGFSTTPGSNLVYEIVANRDRAFGQPEIADDVGP